jgi:predicted secreted hydrolase
MGTYVPARGEPLPLDRDHFSVEPRSFWASPHTGIVYETSWAVQIPSLGLDLSVDAVHPDQELDARGTTLNVYWEGLCTVVGSREGQPVTGDAYVEQANAGVPD